MTISPAQANLIPSALDSASALLVESAALYPAKGVAFFLYTPSLWFYFLGHVLIYLAISIASAILIFIYLLPIQTKLIAKHITNASPWDLVIAIFLCIIESGLGLAGLFYSAVRVVRCRFFFILSK